METGKGAERLQKASELWSRWGWGPVPGVQDLQETSIGWGSVAAQAVGLASSGTPRCTPPPPPPPPRPVLHLHPPVLSELLFLLKREKLCFWP